MPTDPPQSPETHRTLLRPPAPPKAKTMPVPPHKEKKPSTGRSGTLLDVLRTSCDCLTIAPESALYVVGYMVGNLIKAVRLGYYHGRGK